MSTVKGLRDVIRVNYSDLSNLVGSSSLVPGQEYLIQDFRLKHDLCNTSDSYTSTVTEELIVKAVSNNAIGTEAKSTLHPADLIEYSLENMYGSDRGFILRRTDTIKNVTANFDFRYYKVALRQINQTTHANGNFSCNKGTIVCKTGTNELYYKISNEIGYFDSTLNVGTIKHVWELLPFQNLGYYNLMSGISYSTNYISSSVFTDNFGDNIYDDYTLSNVELVADLGDGKIPVIVTGDSEIINSTIKNCCYIDSSTINNSVIDNCNYIKCTEITRSTLKVDITRGLSYITDCNIEYLNFLYVNYCQNNIIKDTSYSSIIVAKNYLLHNRINLSSSVINSQGSSGVVSGNRVKLMKDSYYYGVDKVFDRNLVSGKIEFSIFMNTNFAFNTISGSLGSDEGVETVIYSEFKNNKIQGIFYQPYSSADFINNIINSDFGYDTMNDAYLPNQVGDTFQNNVINAPVYSNTFNSLFTNNKINAKFYGNNIESDFDKNIVNYECSNNTFNSFTGVNIFDALFIGNEVNYFDSNFIAGNFRDNIIEGEMINNKIFSHTEANFIDSNCLINDNVFYKQFRSNQIKNCSFTDNEINTAFYNNKIYCNNGLECSLFSLNTIIGELFYYNDIFSAIFKNNNIEVQNFGAVNGQVKNVFQNLSNISDNKIKYSSIFANNIMGSFTENIINNLFCANTIENAFSNNKIEGFFRSNIITSFGDSYFVYNIINGSFQNNNINACYFEQNIINGFFNFNTIFEEGSDLEIVVTFASNNINTNFHNNKIFCNYFTLNNIQNVSFANNEINVGYFQHNQIYGETFSDNLLTSQGGWDGTGYFCRNIIKDTFTNNNLWEESSSFWEFIYNEIQIMDNCQVNLESFFSNEIKTITNSSLGTSGSGVISYNKIEYVNTLNFYDESYFSYNNMQQIHDTIIRSGSTFNNNTIRSIVSSEINNLYAEHNIIDSILETDFIMNGGLTQIIFSYNKINGMYQCQINCAKFECNTIESSFNYNSVEANFNCNIIKGIFEHNTILGTFGKEDAFSDRYESSSGNLILSDFYYNTISQWFYGNIFRGPVGSMFEETPGPEWGNTFELVKNSEFLLPVSRNQSLYVSNSRIGIIDMSKVSITGSDIESILNVNYNGSYNFSINSSNIRSIYAVSVLLSDSEIRDSTIFSLSQVVLERISISKCKSIHLSSTKLKSSTQEYLYDIEFIPEGITLGTNPGIDFSSSVLATSSSYIKKVIKTPNGTIKMYYHDDLTLAPVYVELNA